MRVGGVVVEVGAWVDEDVGAREAREADGLAVGFRAVAVEDFAAVVGFVAGFLQPGAKSVEPCPRSMSS